jgi:hypothetical protein
LTSTPKGHRSRTAGRFTEEAKPPAKPVLVYLPEPLLEALDAFGRTNGTGRGRSITKLLEDLLPTQSPSEPLPRAEKEIVRLELVRRTDPVYKQYRNNHYIPDRGLVGQQLQYLIFYRKEVVGVIGGASSAFTSQSRDKYWELSTDKDEKNCQLNSIINNNIFKLNYPAPNLATIVLSKWRKQILKDWEELYEVKVAGFETFVVEERLWNGKTRNGACYRADNWELVGITKGYGDTNIRGREHKDKRLQSKKLIYCRKVKGQQLCSTYSASWNNAEKTKALSEKRDKMFADPLDLLLKIARG